MKNRWIFKMIAFAVVTVAAAAAVTFWLWNWLVPDLFNGPAISYWQALGLLVLTRILIRGFAGGGRWSNRQAWKEKWERMSPEEKEKMRELWKKRCGGYDCSQSDQEQKTAQ